MPFIRRPRDKQTWTPINPEAFKKALEEWRAEDPEGVSLEAFGRFQAKCRKGCKGALK